MLGDHLIILCGFVIMVCSNFNTLCSNIIILCSYLIMRCTCIIILSRWCFANFIMWWFYLIALCGGFI